jgi:hypothetical protein
LERGITKGKRRNKGSEGRNIERRKVKERRESRDIYVRKGGSENKENSSNNK